MVRISGVYGPSWRAIHKSDVTLAGDLDVRIESKKINEQKDMIERNTFLEFHKIASTDPNYDIREGVKYIAKLSGINKQRLNFLLRKTTDELEAEEENKLLVENKLTDGKKAVKFHIRQDHDAHIREHMKLDQSIPAVQKHIETHYEAKIYQKNNPDIMEMIGLNATGQEQANANMQGQSIQDLTNTSKRTL